MYKVPISVIKECKDNLQALANHIQENCNLTKEPAKKRLIRARKHIRLLEDNYGV